MAADHDTVIADPRGWSPVSSLASIVVMSLALGACSDGTGGGPDMSGNGPAEWNAVEELRIGTSGIAGPESEQFGSITDIAVDSRGRIYVLDWMSQQISVFDRDGSFSHTIGGEGEGPGEIAGAHVIHAGPGDTLWVVEDGNGRYSRFAPDGTFIDGYPRRIRGSGGEGTVLRDGSLIDWIPHAPDGRFGPRLHLIPVHLTIDDTLQVDTLPLVEHTHHMTGGGMIPETRFGGRLAAAVDASGRIWFAHTQDYRIYERTLDGDTVRTFHREVAPKPTGEAERAYIRENFSEGFATNYLENLSQTRPVILRIEADGAGHLFVFADVAGEPSGTVVDVFEDSGDHVGRMRLPTPVASSPFTPVAHATPGHLYVVVKDELDVPYVQRLRVEPPGQVGEEARNGNREAS